MKKQPIDYGLDIQKVLLKYKHKLDEKEEKIIDDRFFDRYWRVHGFDDKRELLKKSPYHSVLEMPDSYYLINCYKSGTDVPKEYLKIIEIAKREESGEYIPTRQQEAVVGCLILLLILSLVITLILKWSWVTKIFQSN